MLYAPKIALITGATSGFGRETARILSTQYATKLILTGRREQRLKELQAELETPSHILVQDITDTDKVLEDIKNLPDEFQNIDLLINNAGLALGTEPFQDKPLTDNLQMVDTNIKGLLAMTHAVMPGMIARKIGHIINLGSIAGNYHYPGGNTYCGTKAFVNHFSKTLRADLGGTNVRVTSVEPGAIETEFSNVRYKGDVDKADAVYEGYRKMIGREIAEILCWIATQPPHININNIEIMPTDQTFGPLLMTGFKG